MFNFKVSVRKSDIHENGLFADEDIKEGDIIWTIGNNDFLTKIEIIDCSKLLYYESNDMFDKVKDILIYSLYKPGKFYYYLDENKFINHNTNANAFTTEDFTVIAIKDIKKDEEITENYDTYYKDNLLLNFYRKYNIEL